MVSHPRALSALTPAAPHAGSHLASARNCVHTRPIIDKLAVRTLEAPRRDPRGFAARAAATLTSTASNGARQWKIVAMQHSCEAGQAGLTKAAAKQARLLLVSRSKGRGGSHD